MKIKLERSLSIPTVPYAPVKVTVGIEDDIDIKDVEKLSMKLDSIMAIEIIKVLDESITITNVGYKIYLENLKNMYNEILNDMES